MNLRVAPVIGLLAGLAPAAALAQTNIDQGKSPGQIFAADCAVCHKGARGLAHGKSAGALAGFLREHYTTSREQAAELAGYVLKAAAEEAKAASQQAKQPKPEKQEKSEKAEKPEKPEEGRPATAKLQPPADQEPRPVDVMAPEGEPRPPAPVPYPAAGRRYHLPPTTARGRGKEHEAAPSQTEIHEPAAAAPEPTSVEAPNQNSEATPAPSAAVAPSDATPGEATTVPRDNIPD
jgi:hypothetical protein